MKVSSKKWRVLSIIAIGLIIGNLIVYGLYWYLPTFDNGLGDFLLSLVNKYIILFLCIIPTLVLGAILSEIKFLKKYGINYKKGVTISILLFYSLTIISPIGYLVSNRKIKVETDKVETDNSMKNDFVIYETENVKLYFNKSEVVNFCETKLKSYPHLEYLKSFKSYIDSIDSSLTIKQEYVFLPDTFRLVENFGNPRNLDTVLILDRTAKMNLYIDAIDYASTKLLRNGKFRLYDMNKKVFVDYINYQSVSDPLGNLDLYCYLPDGRKFIDRRLLWGL